MADKQKKIISSDADFDDMVEGLEKDVKLTSVNLRRGDYVENTLSSGALAIDLALGGGWQGGKWLTAFGPEGGGKSTLTFFAVAAAQNQKVPVFHYDAEGAADPSYMTRIGIQTDWSKERAKGKRIYYRYYQPESGEQVFRQIHRILQQLPDEPDRKKIQAMFVIDSLPFLVPERRVENDEASPMAAQAKMYSDNIGLIKAPLSAKNCILFAVNQIRLRPGVSYGNPEYEPCGEAVKFASDMRLRISRRSVPHGKGGVYEDEPCWDGNGNDRYVYSIVRTIKNKLYPPFKETWVRLWVEEKGMPGRGVDPFYDVYQYLTMTGQIDEKAGRFYPLIEGTSCNGKRMTWEEFKAEVLNPEKGDELRIACRAQLNSGEAFKLYGSEQGGTIGEGKKAAEEEEEESSDEPAIDTEKAVDQLVAASKKGGKSKGKKSMDGDAAAAEG